MAASTGLLFGSGGLGGPRDREGMECQEKHEDDRHNEKCSGHFATLSIWSEEQANPLPLMNRVCRAEPLLLRSRDYDPGIDPFFHTSNVRFVYL